MLINRHIKIREFSRLRVGSNIESTLDYAEISIEDFNYLCTFIDHKEVEYSELVGGNKSKIFSLIDRETIRVGNFVGVIRTPSKLIIEILPKIYQIDTEHELRSILFDMILVSKNITPKHLDIANLKSKENSLSDWLEKAFLNEFEKIVRIGIKQDYFDIEEEQFFLKGKLDIKKYVQNIGIKDHIFPILNSSFGLNNPENRLIKLALKVISTKTTNAKRKIICNKYQQLMSNVPFSKNLYTDFSKWRNTKLIAHYNNIQPFCELILKDRNPLSTYGTDDGLSLLFPMEKLFESYIRKKLVSNLKDGFNLSKATTTKYLVKQKNISLFQLKPDFIIRSNKKDVLLLDAKWKIINSHSKTYGISQQDIYQMYAYSHNFLKFKGDIVLIYPLTQNFQEPLDPLVFLPGEDNSSLFIVPFDLKTKKIVWHKEKCSAVNSIFHM